MPRKSAVTLCTVALALLAACGESGVDAADVARELQVELPANAHVVTSSAGQPYEDTQGDFCAKVSFLLDHSATSAYVGQHFPKGPLIDETNQAVDVPAPPTYAAATDCTTPANELPTRSPATTARSCAPWTSSKTANPAAISSPGWARVLREWPRHCIPAKCAEADGTRHDPSAGHGAHR